MKVYKYIRIWSGVFENHLYVPEYNLILADSTRDGKIIIFEEYFLNEAKEYVDDFVNNKIKKEVKIENNQNANFSMLTGVSKPQGYTIIGNKPKSNYSNYYCGITNGQNINLINNVNNFYVKKIPHHIIGNITYNQVVLKNIEEIEISLTEDNIKEIVKKYDSIKIKKTELETIKNDFNKTITELFNQNQ